MRFKPTTRLAFGLAIGIQIIATATWYAPPIHKMIVFRYWPYIWNMFCGFLVGALDNPDYRRKTFVLGVVSSVIVASIHWIAGQLGVPVDFRTIGGATIIALISMLIYIPLNILGGALGSLVYRLIIQRMRSEKNH